MNHTFTLLRRVSCAIAALSLCLSAATAGTITQSALDITYQIDGHEPIGQSFTAEDANILSIGFQVTDFNQSFSALLPITVTLFDGAGFAGTNLGSANLLGLTPGYSGWYYADFSFVTLNVGSVYTASISALSVRGGVSGYQSGSLYAGGNAYLFGVAQPGNDLTFSVVAAPPVPDSAVTVPFMLTLLGLFAARRSLRR